MNHNDFSEPLISIAMATYNGEKYLKEQLDSIYAQTHKNIEVIVTDDCSTDNTVKILEQYTKSHGLKYCVNKTNLGFVKNFEKAVSLCEGEYIALSDQDDIWLPGKLIALLDNIGENMLIFSDAMLCDENGVITAQSQYNIIRKAENLLSYDQDRVFIRLLYSNFVTGCTMMMKKEVVDCAHPLPSGIISHDWWYALCASSLGEVIFYDKALVKYRQHSNNVLGSFAPPSYLRNGLNIFSKSYFLYRKDLFGTYRQQLKSQRSFHCFSEKQKKIIGDMEDFYADKISGIFHFKAFLIAYKYRDSIYLEDIKFVRQLRCLRSLVL